MSKSLNDRIFESRRLLQNPYAYLNDLGGFSATPQHDENIEASTDEITRSRLKLQNQYAHLNETGGFDALSNYPSIPHVKKKERYSIDEIEQIAKKLQRSIWQNRNRIWLNKIPSNPIDMLDPVVALKFIGYDCELEETLGQFRSNGKLIEVAGTIDNHSKQVHLSRRYTSNIRSFTAAHELGHAFLHQANGLHRDRPLDGTRLSRNAIELEADKFATFFLMPRKLVKTIFKKFFLTDKFILNEETTFALGLGDFMTQKKQVKTLRQLSLILASAEQFNGLHFISLADQFRVSNNVMAIRLEELELVAL